MNQGGKIRKIFNNAQLFFHSEDAEAEGYQDPQADGKEFAEVILMIITGFKQDRGRNMEKYPHDNCQDIVEIKVGGF